MSQHSPVSPDVPIFLSQQDPRDDLVSPVEFRRMVERLSRETPSASASSDSLFRRFSVKLRNLTLENTVEVVGRPDPSVFLSEWTHLNTERSTYWDIDSLGRLFIKLGLFGHLHVSWSVISVGGTLTEVRVKSEGGKSATPLTAGFRGEVMVTPTVAATG